MLKKIFIYFLGFTFAVSFALGMWFLSCEKFMNNTMVTIDVKIERGESFHSFYNKIFRYLDTPLLFKYFLTKVEHLDQKIRYGHYLFDNQTIRGVLDRVVRGETHKIKITIPEGLNIYEIAKRLHIAGVCDYEIFLSNVKNKNLVKKITGVDTSTFEGFLYPETYYFNENESPEVIISTFYNEFFKNIPAEFEQNLRTYGLSFYEGIILASIIQKESYDPEEMKIIASVFYNRIKKNMRLETDPSIIYGIYDKFNGNLKKKDMSDDSNPYNTYKISGLPPTPISNPHKKALIAVINPAKTSYLYFVADGNGKHIFSENYSTHNKNVYNFQIKKRLK